MGKNPYLALRANRGGGGGGSGKNTNLLNRFLAGDRDELSKLENKVSIKL